MTQWINPGDDSPDDHEKPDYCGEHCECSCTRSDDSLGLSGVCLEAHPTRGLGCTRLDGHDGPHAACGLFEEPEYHPIESWGDTE